MVARDDLDVTFNYHGGNPRSTEAHASIVNKKEEIRLKVYRAIRDSGVKGLTSDEAEVLLGMSHQTVSARFTELKAGNFILWVGKRKTRSGRSADVFISASPDR